MGKEVHVFRKRWRKLLRTHLDTYKLDFRVKSSETNNVDVGVRTLQLAQCINHNCYTAR